LAARTNIVCPRQDLAAGAKPLTVLLVWADCLCNRGCQLLLDCLWLGSWNL
jgi:hypothetical protein